MFGVYAPVGIKILYIFSFVKRNLENLFCYLEFGVVCFIGFVILF